MFLEFLSSDSAVIIITMKAYLVTPIVLKLIYSKVNDSLMILDNRNFFLAEHVATSVFL